MDIPASFDRRATAQSEQADTRQVRNNAGGYTFTVTPRTRLRRFLTLGADGGTYYVNARELTRENAEIVVRFAQERCAELVAEIVAISTGGRAPRQNPALFALAAATALGDEAGRRLALDALPSVARTGTHLFLFARYVEQFRGWGRGLRRAVAGWYTAEPVDDLAYQVLKYRQREGWSHRDLLRLSHPVTDEDERKRLFDWICGRDADVAGLRLLDGFLRAAAAKPAAVPELVREYRLSWEMLPDAALAEPAVWEALLDNGMPQTALLRQLPRLTRLGLLAPRGARTDAVAARLADPARLRMSRVHPVQVLAASRTYASGGRVTRGAGEWTPSTPILDALDAAFYAAFESVEPTGKRHLLALDVSGSMAAPVSGLPISAREASAALALVTAATEPAHTVLGFTGEVGSWTESVVSPLPINPRMRLDDAVAAVSGLPFAATDCALPMRWALAHEVEVDVFTVYTDNETWAGKEHPHQALRRYRERINPAAKLVVVGMTATGFTIADPSDAGMLDVAGFDAAVPGLLADFARGA